jgi:ribonuclease BN (tRNA processing enzyme)
LQAIKLGIQSARSTRALIGVKRTCASMSWAGGVASIGAMKLIFLGTRGNTKVCSRAHRRHSTMIAETARGRVMFDCGADWAERVFALAPAAIFITHAHPDHADGLRQGAPCPVYATVETGELLAELPITVRRIEPKRAVSVCGLSVRAFPVIHSVRAPAVGYRVESDGAALFYAPDIVAIVDPASGLKGVSLYIGDGASPTRPLVRSRGGAPFGHTTMSAQIGWCAKAGVQDAIFTHCGAQIIRMDGRSAAALARRMGAAQGVRARLARDGLTLAFPADEPAVGAVGAGDHLAQTDP